MRSSLTIGFSALGANPLRTLLSTLGVIIGVASLVAVLAMGDGLERFAREQLETTSIQMIEVAPKTSLTVDGVRVPGTNFPTFTLGHAESLAREVSGVAEARLMLAGSARFTARGNQRAAVVMGVAQIPAVPGPVASGRWFTSEELQEGRRVAIVSSRLAQLIAGDSLVLEGHRWEIIGVLPDRPGDSVLRITAPASSAAGAMVPSEWPRAPTLLLKASDVAEVEAVRSRVEQWLGAQDPGWPRGVTVTTNTARARQVRQGVMVFKLAMGAITGISLLVGGIGIMNVLLASVAERTREIGIRKATGARHRDILGQFLAESVAITAAGSIVGVLLGLGGAFGISAIIRAQTRATMYAGFSWGTVAIAVAASVTVGLVFGMYPALRAARLSPIDAIRHE